MKFSSLPWFNRRDIINLVIAEHVKYCLVSKEWFLLKVKQCGSLDVYSDTPSEIKPPPWYAIYYEKVYFARATEIDWDIVYSCKSFGEVSFHINADYTQDERDDFHNKLIQLPLKKNFIVTVSEFMNYDISRFLLRNQLNLEDLEVPLELLKLCFKSNNVSFSNLNSLSINNLSPKIDICEMLIHIPNLKKLTLDSCHPINRSLDFSKKMIKPITELYLYLMFKNNHQLTLDLSKWPSLKKLLSRCHVYFIGNVSKVKIEDLDLEVYTYSLPTVIYEKFLNLTNLNLDFLRGIDIEALLCILKINNSLTSLTLSTWKEFILPEDLPILSYPVTELCLSQLFVINSNLLNWLSDCFNLKKLAFKSCILKVNVSLDPVPLRHLQHLEILCRDQYNGFKNYFNRKLFPHVNRIRIILPYKPRSQVEDEISDTASDVESPSQPVFCHIASCI